MPSVYQQTLEEVAQQIQDMSEFVGLWSDAVPVRRLDWLDVIKIKGVTVRYDDNYSEIESLGTNNRDCIGYPCHVVIVNKSRMVMTEEPASIATFVQALRRKFNNRRRMSDVSDTGTAQLSSRVTKGPRPPSSGEFKDYEIQSYTVWNYFLEPREAE